MTTLQRLLENPVFELWWDSKRGVFRLQSPGRMIEAGPGVEVQVRQRRHVLSTRELTSGRVAAEGFEDVHGPGEEATVTYQEMLGVALALTVRLYSARPFALFRIRISNTGTDPLHIRRFILQTTPAGIHPTAPPTGFYANGWQSCSPAGFLPVQDALAQSLPFTRWPSPGLMRNAMTPAERRPDRFWSETVGAWITSHEALVAGGASLADQFVQAYADMRAGHTTLSLQSQADGIELKACASYASEWFYLEWVALPSVDPLAQYAYAVARQAGAQTPRPAPVGWRSGAVAGPGLTESHVIENIASAALLADEIPLEVIQLGEGYQAQWGDWLQPSAHFPHDLPWLAQRVYGSRFRPGIWLAPLVVHPRSQTATRLADGLLCNSRHRPVLVRLDDGFRAWALDPTHPGVQDHLRETISTIVHTWGYRHVTLDHMVAGALAGRRYDPNTTRAQALRIAYQTIREAAGSDAYLAGSGSPLGPAIGFVDAMRVGKDSAPSWIARNGRVQQTLQRDHLVPCLCHSIRNEITRTWMHHRWWINDSDALLLSEARGELNADEILSQVTLKGLSGGLIFVTDDLDRLPQERRAITAKLYPPLFEGMDVLDLFNRPMPEEVVVPVARPWGYWTLVGMFNWSDEPVERTLPAVVPLQSHRAYHLEDFWNERYLSMPPGAVRPVLHLPPHGVALLSIRSVQSGPHLVGTTFHISQGAEITHWEVAGSEVRLSLNLRRLARGEVWMTLPARPARVLQNDQELPASAVRAIASGVWVIKCAINRDADLVIHLPE